MKPKNPRVTQADWPVVIAGVGIYALAQLLIDFEDKRKALVSSCSGSTWDMPDGRRGWVQITKHGVHGGERLNVYADPEESEFFVSWAALKDWANRQSAAAVEEAKRLGSQRRAHYRTYPPVATSIGHTFAWDRKPRGTDAEVEADHKLLREAQAAKDIERAAWRKIYDEQEVEHRTFIESLAPTEEGDVMLDTVAAFLAGAR